LEAARRDFSCCSVIVTLFHVPSISLERMGARPLPPLRVRNPTGLAPLSLSRFLVLFPPFLCFPIKNNCPGPCSQRVPFRSPGWSVGVFYLCLCLPSSSPRSEVGHQPVAEFPSAPRDPRCRGSKPLAQFFHQVGEPGDGPVDTYPRPSRRLVLRT